MTTDFRALCAQLVELWDADCDTDVEINELLVELRAALAEPEPERAINWPAYFVRQVVEQEQELKTALAKPEPLSLKEQALKHVGVIQDNWTVLGNEAHASPSLTGQIAYEQLDTIRRALEALPDAD